MGNPQHVGNPCGENQIRRSRSEESTALKNVIPGLVMTTTVCELESHGKIHHFQ